MDFLLQRLDFDRLLTSAVAFLPDLVAAVVILAAFWVFYRVSGISLRAVLHRTDFHPTLIHLLVDNIYRFVVLTFALVMAADQIGINVAAALAGLGVAGIAVGFAAQDSLANIISGFVIFWDKPFEVGDWITVAEEYGRVTGITMRTTRIRTPNNTYIVIPNKHVIDQVLVNHSKHGETRVDVPVGIAYKESIPDARSVILDAVRGLQGVASTPEPDVVVAGLGSSSVDLLVRVWIENAGDEKAVYVGVVEASKLALDAAGIQIPFPHLQLFVDQVEDRVWEKASRLPRLAASGGRAAGTAES